MIATTPKDKLPSRGDRDSREAILKVALQLFTQKGYEGTSIEDIRKAAGFKSKASLYNHFKSKEEVVNALTTRILAQIEKIILTAYQSATSDPLAQIIAVLQAFIQWGLTHRQECVFRSIRAHEERMLTGQYDYQGVNRSVIYPLLPNIIQQLRATYPVRQITDSALYHMIMGAIYRAILDQNTFGEISISEQTEQILQVCLGIIFSKSVTDFSKFS
ncbi:putative TetR family transcriptional regulator [Calothrix sp. NIES-2100]|uniref:TetR/AcrR family transcriptional regulator n=1 Tax=Calothrix sp. NIES-2100 TaxID=1954172 RepID=UPI000B5F6E81|nr:putative TetR family transcriptional regulator [Calothrix sp. NIES-2100]